MSYPDFLLAARAVHEYFAARQLTYTCPKLPLPGVNVFIKCGLWFNGAPDYAEGHTNGRTDEPYNPAEGKLYGINVAIKKQIDRTHKVIQKETRKCLDRVLTGKNSQLSYNQSSALQQPSIKENIDQVKLQ